MSASWGPRMREALGASRPKLTVTCAGRTLLVVTDEHPARIVCVAEGDWIKYGLDATGIFTRAIRGQAEHRRGGILLKCTRPGHAGHMVDGEALVAEWQAADSSRKGSRHIDVATLDADSPHQG